MVDVLRILLAVGEIGGGVSSHMWTELSLVKVSLVRSIADGGGRKTDIEEMEESTISEICSGPKVAVCG